VSKAEFYRDELVPEVEEMVISGQSLDEAIIWLMMSEEGVDGRVLRAWALRKHGDEATLHGWAKRRSATFLNCSAQFAGLAQIIHQTPLDQLDRAVVPQFTKWHQWIRQNAWNDPADKQRALAFAKNEIWKKRAMLLGSSLEVVDD
jgi:hypothetical protein